MGRIEESTVSLSSFKGAYPFRLATTSFIYPAGYAENVRKLAPFVDEIELLFFESAPTSLPTKQEIRELESFASGDGISYNIHLPLDIKLGNKKSDIRNQSNDAVLRVAELTKDLHPTTMTLHIDFEGNATKDDDVSAWRERAGSSMEKIFSRGIPPEKFSVENLEYPFSLVAPLVRETGMKACIDVGHLAVIDGDLEDHLKTYGDMAEIMHLYGTVNNHVHGPLTRLPVPMLELAVQYLCEFTGTVSLEVFSFENLKESLDCLGEYWKKGRPHDQSI